jgi:hypothetical protein
MTTTDRLVRLEKLRAELATLLTPTERSTYPTLEQLGDLLEDLRLDAEGVAA